MSATGSSGPRRAHSHAPRRSARLVMCLAGTVLLGLPPAKIALAADPQKARITEWAVPWQGGNPQDPYVDDMHRVWFTGRAGDYLAYLDPFSGKFERFRLAVGTAPDAVVVDGHGGVWYAGAGSGQIGKLDLRSKLVFNFSLPHPKAQDPRRLTLDGQGYLWFTVTRGNFVGRLDTRSGAIRLISVPTADARPDGITIDADHRPWIAEYGANKLAMVDPATMNIREFVLPRTSARPRRVCVTPRNEVWYTDYAGGFIGRLEPASGAIHEWPVPGGRNARPYALAADHRGRVWLVETGRSPNRFIGFDPESERFFSAVGLASGGHEVRDMHFYAPSNEMWFATDANTIGRAELP
jgi:virginiamycin B lyase